MKNLVLITSVINIPNIPLSYTNIRSVYTCEERFIQTQKTIESLRRMIPDLEILLVECSDLKVEYEKYLKSNCEHYIKGIEYIELNSLIFDSFFKISGRYYLSDSFQIEIFNNKKICCRNCGENSTFTLLYKIPYCLIFEYKNFLLANYILTYHLSQEEIMRKFVNNYDIFEFEKFHLEGNIAICGSKIKY